MLRDCNETVKCYPQASSISPLRGNATTKGILLPKNGILLPYFHYLKYFDYFFKILFFDSQSNEIM